MIFPLPLKEFGLKNIPAVPLLLTFSEPILTLLHLARRALEVEPAKNGLTNTYTIDGQTGTANDFLFGRSSAEELKLATAELERILSRGPESIRETIFRGGIASTGGAAAGDTPLTALSLDKPADFSISWTNYDDIYKDAQPLLGTFAETLTSVDTAEAEFWPTIANHGVAYNLILLETVTSAQRDSLRPIFGELWADGRLDAAQQEGRLYAIDLSLFGYLQPQTVDGLERFTPATLTLLEQDAATKQLTPIAIHVANGPQSQMYSRSRTPGAWLYALQAAKASITVYGIWLGHVYHWHIVTAALQMTMANTLAADHPISLATLPQSNYLIGFDEVLLLLWDYIAPPTSIATPLQFLELCDKFAQRREYFDDDPRVTLSKAGLDPALFTKDTPWDLYPVVRHLLTLWDDTAAFVEVFVDTTYASDEAVALDTQLQLWMTASADPDGGNIRGLPEMHSKKALKAVLTSFLYRITAHGVSRLNVSANPVLTFTANFPPCLQDSRLPGAQEKIDTKALLQFLPKTGTIGKMVNFYFTFVFSQPYEPFIPAGGVESDLFFPTGLGDPRNAALVTRRKKLIAFIEQQYEPTDPQVGQWPMSIET